jgi:hypothetical protein
LRQILCRMLAVKKVFFEPFTAVLMNNR